MISRKAKTSGNPMRASSKQSNGVVAGHSSSNNKRAGGGGISTKTVVGVLFVAFLAIGWVGCLFTWATLQKLSHESTETTADVHSSGDNKAPIRQESSADYHHDVSRQQQEQQPPPDNSQTQTTVYSSKLSFSTDTFHSFTTVRDEFLHRYDTPNHSALDMLERGVQRFGNLTHTATRILHARATNLPFVLSFAGYSVTVGRGNYYHQSYPFVLEQILQPLLRSTLQVELVVRNAAIGGIPSFPYGFCLGHFLGRDASVVSWDYSMNEDKKAANVLESYVRQSQAQLPHKPMMIVLDTNVQRCKLLKDYADAGLIQDALCVGMAKDVVKDKSLLEENDTTLTNGTYASSKPLGFQQWDVFGAGPKCPGRGAWHPKKMEHELVGWMMAMYFVEAAELAQSMLDGGGDVLSSQRSLAQEDSLSRAGTAVFPPPLTKPPPENSQAVTDLLFGHANDDTGGSVTVKHVSCRTHFLPAAHPEQDLLSHVVVSGSAPSVTADNIMDVRSDETYASGWVLDVSQTERDTKVKVQSKACGGLGYVDMKIALYGVPESGPLVLWLPTETTHHADHSQDDAADSDLTAKHWFDELVVCEANEKRKEGACRLDADIEFMVGGATVPSTTMIDGAGKYLKRKTCLHVGIPDDATITRYRDVRSSMADSSSASVYEDSHVGVMVQLRAKEGVTRAKGACCLSHIVWEQH